MAGIDGQVYIGTLLLERNRHAPGKTPTYRVSQWLERFAEAGFDGMELWENHAALCAPEELRALESASFPVAVFNSYAAFDEAGEADRRRAADLTSRLRAAGVKFNFGKDPKARAAYVKNARAWQKLLPGETRPLCECHPGTIVEEPEQAALVFDELGRGRFQAIVHPFRPDLDKLRQWFRALGPSITHAHVQMRDDSGEFLLLESNPNLAKEALRVMRGEGYRGSFTLEFTAGVRAPQESMERLFEAALRDLLFLRENWP